MAETEGSESEKQKFIQGNSIECSITTPDHLLVNGEKNKSDENGVELNVGNNQHFYHSFKDFGNDFSSEEHEVQEENSGIKYENNTALEIDGTESEQNDRAATLKKCSKTTILKESQHLENVQSSALESKECSRTDFDDFKFDSYNHAFVEAKSDEEDGDFHKISKPRFANVEEAITEVKHSHNNLCQGEKLEWFDHQHQKDTIHRLNVFRKNRKFCDLVLLVGGHEIYCHRVVVGVASVAIYDELCLGEQESGPIARIPIDASKSVLSPVAVEILIDYMYTSRLIFDCENLTAVYRAALLLGVERVIPICRRHLKTAVDTDQCIQMRRLVKNYGDTDMKYFMDNYIEENFESVSGSNEFLSLPRIKMEVIISANSSVANLLSVNLKDGWLSSTALIWISNVIKGKGGNYLEDLTEQIQRVSLEDLNVAASHTNEHNMRRISQEAEHRKTSEGSGRYFTRNRLTRSSSMDSLKSSDSNDSTSRVKCDPEGEWKVIAFLQVRDTDHTIALCSLGDVLCALSIRIPSTSSPHGDLPNGHDLNYNHHSSVSSSSASCCSSVGSFFHFCPMNQPRSAAGVAQIDGKIIVAGGFNQSESLDTVECFDISSNRWSNLSRMSDKRGRFSVAVLNGQLYAVGGSTGSHDLSSVERYESNKDVWTHVQSLPFACSGAGVAVLLGRLYCVGGVRQNSGLAGLKACQAFDPMTNEWSYCASLLTGRSSVGVAALGDHLYAVAGSDGWKCLNSAERYDPATNVWSVTASLHINRRGLGLTEHNGSLYCVGGSDGQSFLSSVERYNPAEGDFWTLTGSSLGVPRNCAGVTSANGSVFVVGGFSGRQFLSSVEAIEDSASEWSSHDSPSSKNVSSDAKDSSSE